MSCCITSTIHVPKQIVLSDEMGSFFALKLPFLLPLFNVPFGDILETLKGRETNDQK